MVLSGGQRHGQVCFQSLQKEPTMLTHWFWTSSLQNHERINFSRFKSPRLWLFVTAAVRPNEGAGKSQSYVSTLAFSPHPKLLFPTHVCFHLAPPTWLSNMWNTSSRNQEFPLKCVLSYILHSFSAITILPVTQAGDMEGNFYDSFSLTIFSC